MKRVLTPLVFLLLAFFAQAHPGIGIVYDGDQTIYYTDLTHVWKLNTRTGVAEIYIENVHTHELFLDKEGNLYGEHYWYIESQQVFKNYIWKVDKNGNFQKIREDQEGENEDFSFVRDESFASYYLRKTNSNYEIIKKDSLNEKVLHSVSLNHPAWKYLNSQNELLFIDYPSVYSANQEEIKVLSEDISAKRFPFSIQSDHHSIYGLWTDQNANVYVAIYGGREIKRIDQSGESKRVLKTSFFWSPVNGVFDKNQNLWVMECKLGGAIRVRKVEQSQLGNSSFLLENGIILTSLLLIGRFIYAKVRKRRLRAISS